MQNQQQFDVSGRKLFFAIPAYDFKVGVKLMGSLVEFARLAPQYGIQFAMGTISGCSVVSRARNLLVDDFLQTECDTLMFIDADMTFDPNDIIRLLAFSGAGAKNIVGGTGVARKKEKTFHLNLDKDEDGNLLMDAMGLARAKQMGTGFMMVQRQVFEVLIDRHPEWRFHDVASGRTVYSLFDFKSTPEGYIGEDYNFCDRARAEGFQVWVDPTIKLGHMGVMEYEGAFGEDYLYPMIQAAQEAADNVTQLRVAYG